jgi:hypothetical protein
MFWHSTFWHLAQINQLATELKARFMPNMSFKPMAPNGLGDEAADWAPVFFPVFMRLFAWDNHVHTCASTFHFLFVVTFLIRVISCNFEGQVLEIAYCRKVEGAEGALISIQSQAVYV